MNRTDILKDILKILERYEGRGAHRASLTESTSLVNDLDIDSARMVDIVIDAETKFGISIDDSKLDAIKTVGDIVNLVDGLLNVPKRS